MPLTDVPLFATAVVFLLVGIGLLSYWIAKVGYFNFFRPNHYYALIFFVLAGILTWLGLVFPVNPEKFEVTNKQWVALGFSIAISVLWWLRYSFSISPDTILEETDD